MVIISNPEHHISDYVYCLTKCLIIFMCKMLSYDPKTANLAQAPDSKAKSAAIARANDVQASLPDDMPSFVKPMLPSHVTGGFWLVSFLFYDRKCCKKIDDILCILLLKLIFCMTKFLVFYKFNENVFLMKSF